MSEFLFNVTKLNRVPSKAAYQRAAKRIKEYDPAVSLNGAGFPAVTHCKYQIWCVVPEWGNASTVYRGEEAAKFQKIIEEELGKYRNVR